MADKFRKTHPLAISFVDGEQPTSEKLSFIATQARNGLDLIERAIGDLWGQSGDSNTSQYPNQIGNLARAIGQMKYLNPIIYPLTSDIVFNDYAGERYTGESHGHCRFIHDSSVSITLHATGADPSPQPFRQGVTSAGNWWVDTTGKTGEFFSFTPLAAGDYFTYTIDDSANFRNSSVVPFIVPDPRQATFRGVRIELNSGDYYIHLPPRSPLDFASPGAFGNEPDNYFSTAEQTANTGTTAEFLFANTSMVNAPSGLRYPLTPEISGISSGTPIPDGMMFLWDQSAESIVEGLTFYRTGSDYLFRVVSTLSPHPLAGKETSSDTESDYKDYSVILGGSSITKVIDDLRYDIESMSLGRSGPLSSPSRHTDTEGHNPSHGSSHYPSATPTWMSSFWNNDDHVSLLSRAGSQSNAADRRDRYNNAMLGHLILANSDISTPSSALNPNTPASSFHLYFGSTDGSSIFSSSIFGTTNILQIEAIGILQLKSDHGIYFQDVGGGGGGWHIGTGSDNNIVPSNDAVFDIGTPSMRVGTLYSQFVGDSSARIDNIWTKDINSYIGHFDTTSLFSTSLLGARALIAKGGQGREIGGVSGTGGTGIEAQGGNGPNAEKVKGGTGIKTFGGIGNSGENGGIGIEGIGGSLSTPDTSTMGGTGGYFKGGNGTLSVSGGYGKNDFLDLRNND